MTHFIKSQFTVKVVEFELCDHDRIHFDLRYSPLKVDLNTRIMAKMKGFKIRKITKDRMDYFYISVYGGKMNRVIAFLWVCK